MIKLFNNFPSRKNFLEVALTGSPGRGIMLRLTGWPSFLCACPVGADGEPRPGGSVKDAQRLQKNFPRRCALILSQPSKSAPEVARRVGAAGGKNYPVYWISPLCMRPNRRGTRRLRLWPHFFLKACLKAS